MNPIGLQLLLEFLILVVLVAIAFEVHAIRDSRKK